MHLLLVQILRTNFVLLLALLWAPLASHCRIEAVVSLEALACCDHQAAADSHQKDCHNSACATVESGQYQSALQRLTVPPPDLQLHFELAAPKLIVLSSRFARSGARLSAAAPPPASWPFAFRTALPPRAPSFVS
jgi:hypothetical protein